MKENFKIIGDKKLIRGLFARVARRSGGKELIEGVTLPCTVELALAKDMPSEHTTATYDIESNHIRLNSAVTKKALLAKAFGDALKRARQMEEKEFPVHHAKKPGHTPKI